MSRYQEREAQKSLSEIFGGGIDIKQEDMSRLERRRC